MFTKANQITKRPKTEMLFEKETQKKLQHKQRKISCLSTCCPHVLSWVLLYTKSMYFTVPCCRTKHPACCCQTSLRRWTHLPYLCHFPWCHLEGFCDRSYSTGFGNGTVESATQFSQSRLPYFTVQTYLCAVLHCHTLYGDDCVPLVMRSSPTLSITLSCCPLLHPMRYRLRSH